MEKGNSFRDTPTPCDEKLGVSSPKSTHSGEQERLTKPGGRSSAEPFLDASDPPGELHILWVESNSASM